MFGDVEVFVVIWEGFFDVGLLVVMMFVEGD